MAVAVLQVCREVGAALQASFWALLARSSFRAGRRYTRNASSKQVGAWGRERASHRQANTSFPPP